MRHNALLGIFLGLFTAAAIGQGFPPSNVQHNEIAIQYDGVFTAHRGGAPTHYLATRSGGFLIDYRMHVNSWEAFEVQYGYTRNGQSYFTPATAAGAPAANYYIAANMHQLFVNEVVTTPKFAGFQPFVLGGGGALFFRPRGASAIAASNQTRGAFDYGVGLDFTVDHIGARIEYRGLIFKVPDFGNPLLTTDRWTHVAQPSVGLVFTF